ncbi:hypothetical protein GVN16_18155 [Emticicia sp. CRIBPO]|uniref:hypothetical protein n=1 Tax=Emticicia sp. CRIBPO TaxID=2683258 RepID=UPI0014127B5D|nr:hypothetical protein [Emticicia sp. CRIBPO]NBA87699.1 hypothetical protein [Emticicia sp. CRIBPO]
MRNILFALLFLVTLACSTDRLFSIDDKEPQKPVAGKDSTEKEPEIVFVSKIPENVRKQAEVVTIKSDQDLPFITKNGTKIYIKPLDFNPMPGGTYVTYPFKLEVTELLSIKDIILNEKPTVSNGRLLTTDGQILIKAYKDNQELSVYKYSSFRVDMRGLGKPTDRQGMSIFLGQETPDGFNWVPDSVCKIETTTGCQNIFDRQFEYRLFPASIGWINIDKFIGYTNTTSIAFKSDMNLENIRTFLYFPDLVSVMKVNYEKDFPVPVGAKAKVISFAMTTDEQYYTFFEDIVIRPEHLVNIKLTKTTKEDFMKELEKL